MRWFNRFYIKLLILLTGGLLMHIQTILVLSQDEVHFQLIASPFDIEGIIGNLSWSNNSRHLIFADVIVLPTNEWYQYDLESGKISSSSHSPLQLELEKNERALVTTKLPSGTTRVYPISRSDDRRYLIYIYTTGDTVHTIYGSFPAVQLGVADLQQNEVFTFSNELPGAGNIIWSADSSAFISVLVVNPSVWINVLYITNYMSQISNAVLHDLRYGLWMNGEGYAINGAYDISLDGSRVLLRVNAPPEIGGYRLYIYDGRLPTNDQLILDFDATRVIAGSFAPGDETKLWLFNEIGVVQYDLVTRETTVLNTEFNSTMTPLYDSSLFSPDGRRLGVIVENKGLYLLDLTDEAETITSRPVKATPIPTTVGLLRLSVTTDCPPTPTETLTWQIHNPNPESVVVSWETTSPRPTGQTGTVEIAGGSSDEPGSGSFETQAADPGNSNTVRIYVDDVFHDARSCVVPREG